MKRSLIAAIALFGAADAAAFVQSKTPESRADMQWNTRFIEYRINEVGSDDMDFETLEEQVARSFAPWSMQLCGDLEIGLRFVYDGPTAYGADPDREIGYDDVNVIAFREARSQWNFDNDVIAVTTVSFCEGRGGVCDHAGEILDADIEVNGFNFRFSTGDITPGTRFDLRNTLTHEVGHLLGFDHTSVEDATMFPSAPPGENSKRTLEQDDINALCTVYKTIWDEDPHGDGDDCSATPRPSSPTGWALALGFGLLAFGWRRR